MPNFPEVVKARSGVLIQGGVAAAGAIALISNVLTACAGSSGWSLADSSGAAELSSDGTNITSAKPIICGTIYGGTAAGSDLTLIATSNGSPSGANIYFGAAGALGSIAETGAWTLGPAISAGVNGVAQKINTGDQGYTFTSTHGAFTFCNAASLIAFPAITAQTQDVNGAMILASYTNDSNNNADMMFRVANYTNSGTYTTTTNLAYKWQVNETDIGTVSRAGAWTLGTTSLSGYHTLQASSGRAGGSDVASFYIAGSNAATIQLRGSTNEVSIGHSEGQAYYSGISGKTASGGSTVYVTSGHLLGTSTSVREAKTNIAPLASTLPWLLQLKPYVYQYRKQVDGVYTDEPEDFINTGLIYDEVKEVNPQLCFDTADGKPSGVEYTRLITPMLKAIQELSAKLDEANAEIARLRDAA